ncbi:MAG: hypothetical protein COB04_14275 [Gammaproteobacteria bacterium]|nr:MAG: hypothetical protein COB04_14275 [Gammaproteobacteria bacterium]
MLLIERIKQSLEVLFEQDDAWPNLLSHHGWPISLADLQSMSTDQLESALLSTELKVDRSLTGFKDFISNSERLVSPGKPFASLLYHALASPHVIEQADGFEIKIFPSIAVIEDVENYIYAARKASLEQIMIDASTLAGEDRARLEFAVCSFSAEYRPQPATVQLTHADHCYSRTGVARVGTSEAYYNPQLRGFSVFKEGDDAHQIRVLPCRYAAYLSVKLRDKKKLFGPVNSLNQTGQDEQIDFWVPLHKLFDGEECVQGLNLKVEQQATLYNQKLEKLSTLLRDKDLSTTSDAQLLRSPFRVSEGIASFSDAEIWGQGVLSPNPHPLVSQTKDDNDAFVNFRAPAMGSAGFSDAFSPSLLLDINSTSEGRLRPAPEFVHVRDQVEDDGSVTNLSDQANVVALATKGGYQALHYSDYAGDGWVTPTVTDLNENKPLGLNGNAFGIQSAFSIVSAPDFFPKVRQRQVYEWWQSEVPEQNEQGKLPRWWAWLVDNGHWSSVWRAPPNPLSDERVAANIQLPDTPFNADDVSVTAIVSLLQDERVAAAVTTPVVEPDPPPRRRRLRRRFARLERMRLALIAQMQTEEEARDQVSIAPPAEKIPFAARNTYLPDAASGIFAPGWDVSVDSVDSTVHLAAYGLGSPFPEDAKLCAALSTFWPAAAPDSTRNYFNVPRTRAGSIVPLTDSETGVGEGALAWDGVPGPQVVSANSEQLVVEYPDYPRVDYTKNALEGKFSIDKTSRITLEEYKRRMVATLRMYRAIGKISSKDEAHILSFQKVATDLAELELAQERSAIELQGPVYRFQGFNNQVDGSDNVSAPEAVGESQQRAQYQVTETWTVFVGSGDHVLIRTQDGDGSVRVRNWQALNV